MVTDITERVKQAREIEHLNRLYSVLSRVSQAVVRATSPEKFLEQACREVVEGGGFLLAWIGKVELTTNAVVPTALWGRDRRVYPRHHGPYRQSTRGAGTNGHMYSQTSPDCA